MTTRHPLVNIIKEIFFSIRGIEYKCDYQISSSAFGNLYYGSIVDGHFSKFAITTNVNNEVIGSYPDDFDLIGRIYKAIKLNEAA